METNLKLRWASHTLAALSLWTVTACTGEETLPGDDTLHTITFATRDVPSTRAKVISELRKTGIFGYSHAGNFSDATASRIPDYFLNTALVDLPGDGTWTYSGVHRYWPANDFRLSFFAYAPYIDVEEKFSLYPKTSVDPGGPKITYSVPVRIEDQIDLMWANRIDQTFQTNDGLVEFDMEHALTRIDFEVGIDPAIEAGRPLSMEITKLFVRNVIGGGVLHLSKSSTDAGLWTYDAPADGDDLATYTMTNKEYGGLVKLEYDARELDPGDPKVWKKLFRDDHHLMLIPQPLDGKGIGLPAEVVLTYSVKNWLTGEVETKVHTLPLSLPALNTWRPGMGVTYKITVSPIVGLHIELDIEGFIEGTKWEEAEGYNPVGNVG